MPPRPSHRARASSTLGSITRARSKSINESIDRIRINPPSASLSRLVATRRSSPRAVARPRVDERRSFARERVANSRHRRGWIRPTARRDCGNNRPHCLRTRRCVVSRHSRLVTQRWMAAWNLFDCLTWSSRVVVYERTVFLYTAVSWMVLVRLDYVTRRPGGVDT